MMKNTGSTIALMIGLALLAGGCSIHAARKKPDHIETLNARAKELRVQMRARATRFMGIVEGTLDELRNRSDDPALRKELLVRKINAIARLQEAMLRPNPVAALVDTWSLVVQSTDLRRADLKNMPDEYREMLTEIGALLEGELEFVLRQTSPDSDWREMKRLIHEWAADNRLDHHGLTSRKSTETLFARLRAMEKLGLFSVAGELPEVYDDLIVRVDVYSAYLPKQARWQAELLMDETLDGKRVSSLMTQIQSTLLATQRILEEMPDLVSGERSALLEELDRQLDRLDESLRRERTAVTRMLRDEGVRVKVETDLKDIQDLIRHERQALVELLETEGVKVRVDLSSGLDSAVPVLAEQRAALVEDLRAASDTILDNTEVSLKALIDHFFLRLAQLFGVMGILIIIGFIFFRLTLFRNRT
jgi:hypothetical protein